MTPRPIVTGSISASTCLTRGSRQSNDELELEAQPAQHRERHRELDDRADEDADRVGVELVVAARRTARGATSRTMITTFQTSGESAGIVKWS